MSLLFPKNPKFEGLYKELVVSVWDIASLFEKVSKNFKDFKKYAKEAQKIEEQADSVAHQIVLELNSAFITPFDRDDMYKLAMEIDDIIDHIENTIHSLSIYEVKKKHDCINQFAELYTESAKDLDSLIQTFFEKKHNVEKINKIVVAIHREENEWDEIYITSIRDLFQNEKDAIELIKWKEIVESLEVISDKFKDVTDTVINALMKNG